MAGRTPKVTDDEILAATQRAMGRKGPHELTLADIADEAGITAGRLVQRFGSKRGLLLALSERFAGSAPSVFAGLRASHRSPLAIVRAYVSCMAGLAATPDAFLRNLAYLMDDLSDEALRKHLVANARATKRELTKLFEEAVVSGEIRANAVPATLARTIDALVHGSLMTWATYRDGKAADWIARDLDAVLAPWLATPPHRSRRRRRDGRSG